LPPPGLNAISVDLRVDALFEGRMSFEMDESEWPLVVARWRGTPTEDEFSQAMGRIDAYLHKSERFALLIDGRGGGSYSPEQRATLIRYMKENAELTRRYLIQAIVIDNLVVRTLFYGINVVFPNAFPSKVFSDTETARAWLLAMLEDVEPK
jgi:hypothetical protein